MCDPSAAQTRQALYIEATLDYPNTGVSTSRANDPDNWIIGLHNYVKSDGPLFLQKVSRDFMRASKEVRTDGKMMQVEVRRPDGGTISMASDTIPAAYMRIMKEYMHEMIAEGGSEQQAQGS